MNYSECWFKPIIPELGRQRQKDQEFKATVSYIEKKQSQSGHFRKKKHISEEPFTYMAHCSLSFQIFHLSSTSRHFSKVKLIQETGCPPHPTPPHRRQYQQSTGCIEQKASSGLDQATQEGEKKPQTFAYPEIQGSELHSQMQTLRV